MKTASKKRKCANCLEVYNHFLKCFILCSGSEEPRHPRPPHIKYRVGQVVTHKIHNYRGVIVAWDEKAKAPEWWIKKIHGKEQIDEPNYTILIDTRGNIFKLINQTTFDLLLRSFDSTNCLCSGTKHCPYKWSNRPSTCQALLWIVWWDVLQVKTLAQEGLSKWLNTEHFSQTRDSFSFQKYSLSCSHPLIQQIFVISHQIKIPFFIQLCLEFLPIQSTLI